MQYLKLSIAQTLILLILGGFLLYKYDKAEARLKEKESKIEEVNDSLRNKIKDQALNQERKGDKLRKRIRELLHQRNVLYKKAQKCQMDKVNYGIPYTSTFGRESQTSG